MKSIIFNTPMIRAILAGHKTVTRKLVKYNNVLGDPEDWCPKADSFDQRVIIGDYRRFCPLGTDKLWVRESWGLEEYKNPPKDQRIYRWIHYKADNARIELGREFVLDDPLTAPKQIKKLAKQLQLKKRVQAPVGDEDGIWRPSIHMPNWASRLTLKIINVRVERIQDMTYQEAMREGIPQTASEAYTQGLFDLTKYEGYEWDNRKSVDNYRYVWDKIYPHWDENPWVWRIEFEVEK